MQWLRERLAHVKTPRQIDFMQELPRHATGKLYKRLIRDTYWGNADVPVALYRAAKAGVLPPKFAALRSWLWGQAGH